MARMSVAVAVPLFSTTKSSESHSLTSRTPLPFPPEMMLVAITSMGVGGGGRGLQRLVGHHTHAWRRSPDHARSHDVEVVFAKTYHLSRRQRGIYDLSKAAMAAA